jgi:hypothetical protein
MKRNFSKVSIIVTAIVTVAIWLLLAWSHYHGGVPSHHLLARKDLPSVSNWWGGVLLPLLTWFLLYRIRVRLMRTNGDEQNGTTFPFHVLYGFACALLFGILLSVFFTSGNQDFSGYMVNLLVVLAFLLPVYRAECLLGFILGMTFTFGTVLPTLIGSVFALVGAVLYLYIRPLLLYIVSLVLRVVSPGKYKAGTKQD